MGLLLQLLSRFLGNRSRRQPPPSRLARYQSYGRPHRPVPPRQRRGGQRGGRVGFFGPLPYYSTTTRRGTSVSVGGCCLPIPLMMLAGTTAAGLLVRRRVARTSAGVRRS